MCDCIKKQIESFHIHPFISGLYTCSVWVFVKKLSRKAAWIFQVFSLSNVALEKRIVSKVYKLAIVTLNGRVK